MKFNFKKGKILLTFLSIIGIILLFFGYNYLTFTTSGLHNSPDETMHANFIAEFAKNNKMHINHPEDYGPWRSFVFPRSTYAVGSKILPVGFWGLNVVYGSLAKIVGLNWVVFFTPFLVLFAGYALYNIFSLIFSKKIALVSLLLFFTHPVVWYYTARGLLPNVPFICFLIIGAWILLCKPLKTNWLNKSVQFFINNFFGIFFIFVSILIRPSEVWWIGLAFLIIIFSFIKRYNFKVLFVWIPVAILFAFIYWFINKNVYGSGISTYSISSSHVLNQWYHIFFPFGINIYNVLKTTYYYIFSLYWWLSIPAFLGIMITIWNWANDRIPKYQIVYLFVTLVTSLYLLLLYGSYGDVRSDLRTIGIAYSRYWLPIFILLLPYIFISINFFIKKFPKNIKNFLIVLVILITGYLNYTLVFEGIDGLIATQKNIQYGTHVSNEIKKEISKNSLIVTYTEDKFFWPELQVLGRIDNVNISKAIVGLLKMDYPIYMYGPTNINVERLTEQGLLFGYTFEEEKRYGLHSLFKISLVLKESSR